MKNFVLIFVHAACGLVLCMAACSGSTKSKLKGNWHSKDGSIKLKITGKEVITNNDATAAEQYTIKEDTLLTSFQGNRPFTKLVIQNLDENNMKLQYPDSVSIEFLR